MTRILVVGDEPALLEGLSQSLASAGFSPVVAHSLGEARDIAVQKAPLVAVISRPMAAAAGAEMLGIPLAPGGALILFRTVGSLVVTLSPTVQRAVMADLTLPLERNRLVALAQHVGERARETGRDRTSGPTDLGDSAGEEMPNGG